MSLWAQNTLAQPVSADSPPDPRWEAVGRLEIGGAGFCTGALIEPHIVLTAAHCLYDRATGAELPVDDIRFLAGWRDGRPANHRRVRRTAIHPAFDFTGPEGSARVRNDLALVELQLPIRTQSVVPFGTEEEPDQGAQVGVVSYAHNRSEAPSLQEMCHVFAKQDGILVLSCTVDFGASGSPVFTFDNTGQARIVSVVSAKAEAAGQQVSLATDLQAPLAVLRQELARKQNPDAAVFLVSAKDAQREILKTSE